MLGPAFLSLLSLANLSLGSFIDNTVPRRDVMGQLMDVHDGNVLEHDGLWYWWGMGYTDCQLETGLIPPRNCPGIYLEFGHCGFRTDHAVNLYTSPDLEHWTFVTDIFPPGGRPEGIYFRPKVVFNRQTEEWVLWVNHLAPALSPLLSYPEARLVVATSSSPQGPFTLVTEKANIEISGGGDFGLMVDPSDENGTAYIAYDAWGNNHAVVVERLTPDYHDSLGADQSSGQISPTNNEAPILFSRQGWYFLLYGQTCCFCEAGSGARAWVAPHPLGPWTDTGTDVNPGSWLGHRDIAAQCNAVITITSQAGESLYLYTGDLWSSAPDNLKSHDIQYWSPPLEFDDTTSPPSIRPMTFVNNFTLFL